MCISLNKANRIRLIVSSTDISEEAELRLTSMLNETIKNYWVALGEFAVVGVINYIGVGGGWWVTERSIHFTFNHVENQEEKVHFNLMTFFI